jgi:FG-GAP-like repeat
LVDLDGDGDTDVLSGSYNPGDLYLFRRGEGGKFSPGEKIKDRNGKEIQFTASVPFAADWNGDGLLDLLVGNIEGEVHFIPNEGKATEPAFGSPQALSADGKPIQVPHGDSGPVVADWDGDRVLDLLVGCGDGSVQFYRNVGTKKEPRLAAAKTLVPASPEGKAWSGGLKENEWGVRVKVCVTDWNGDGKPDLLLGDRSSRKVNVNLSDKEKAEVEKAKKRHQELMQDYQKVFGDKEYQAAAEAYRKETEKEKKEALRKDLERLQEERQKKAEPLLKEIRELSGAVRKADPLRNAGYVFVFLRR